MSFKLFQFIKRSRDPVMGHVSISYFLTEVWVFFTGFSWNLFNPTQSDSIHLESFQVLKIMTISIPMSFKLFQFIKRSRDPAMGHVSISYFLTEVWGFFTGFSWNLFNPTRFDSIHLEFFQVLKPTPPIN